MPVFRAVFVAAATALSVAPSSFGQRAAIPIAAFVGDPDRSQVQLSGDGRVIGFLAPRQGVLNVWVQSIENDALVGDARAVTMSTTRSVERWAFVPGDASAPSEVVYFVDERGDDHAQAWAVSIAGGEPKCLTLDTAARADLLAVDRDHPHEVLLRLTGADPARRDVWRFDARAGSAQVVFRDEDECADVFVDAAWRVRVVTHRSERGELVARIRERDDAPWKAFHTWSAEDRGTSRVVSLSRDGSEVYVVDSGRRTSLPTGALCAVSATPEGPTQTWRVLAASSRCEPGAIVFDPSNGRPLGARFTHDRPWMKAMDAQFEEDVIAIRKLATGELRVEGSSDDGALLLVSYTFERSGDEYWLFRRGRGGDAPRGRRLFAARDGLHNAELGPRSVATVRSRDGMPLVVYHAAPPGYDLEVPKPMPMVVLLHDVEEARADWDFDPIAAWLGELGYATLAVNVRGTVGFGKRWRAADDRDGVSARANDVIDALNWAVEGSFADPSRVAMMGTGDGGALAIELLARAPERFVGAISIATHIAPSTASALNDVARPLLVGHGRNDATYPCADVERMVGELGDRGRSVTTWFGAGEGHRITRADHRIELYGIVQRFLAEHLRAPASQAVPSVALPGGVDATEVERSDG